MTEPRLYGLRSLRFKLILASIAVEAVMLSVLVWNSTRITGDAMQKTFQDRLETLIPLMVVGLTSPLVQRDYATLDERLGKMVSPKSLVYIELRDELGKVVASRGPVPETAHLDTSFEVNDHVYDQTFDLALAGQLIGRARYGLNVSRLEASVRDLRNQGALVALAEIALTIALLVTLGALLTNHLRTLAGAARSLAGGDYSVRVPVIGRDEVAETASAFNVMATTVEQDIIDRRRAREVLQQSEQRLRNIIDGLGPSMFVGLLTLDGVVLEANEQALAAAGLKREDVLGKPVAETYWFSYSEASQQQMRDMVACGARGEASRCDVQIRAEENQFIHLDFSMQPFRDVAGNVILLVPSAIVITERKEAERALHESEAGLRLALDAAHMGIYDWDVVHHRIIWSRWHEELWGFKPGEFDGTYEGFSKRVNTDDLHIIEDKIARSIAEHTPYQGEFRVVWPDHSVHWITGRGEFTFDNDGKPLRMRGVVMEITERKQAEAAVRDSERNLTEAQRIAHVGSWRWNLGGPVQWTDELYRIFGVSRETFTPTVESFFELVYPEDRPGMQAWLEACMAGKGAANFEFRAVRPDGTVRNISGRGELLLDAAGHPVQMVGTAQDITDIKRAEAALREAKRDMERKVMERTAELNAAQLELHAKNEELIKQNRRVEEANRLKSQFLANMSHELRTPLNAIIGFSELIHDGKVGPVADNHKEYLGDVLTSAQHLLQLINDVLDLAKVESGKMEFFYAQMDLRKIINEVCDVLRTLMSRTRTRVSIEIGAGLDEVWVDASKLKQVLYNYLSNAMKFSREGGQVAVRARREGLDAYRIEVEDNGVGIKTEDLPRLFSEFQQLDLSASKKYQGTGLGLALTKRIIESQGGRVGVESVRGQGSIFYVILPLRQAETEVAL